MDSRKTRSHFTQWIFTRNFPRKANITSESPFNFTLKPFLVIEKIKIAEPASESSVPKPDDFHSQLLKLLEDESSTEESSCGKEAISRRHRSSTAKKMIKDGKRADRDDESVNRDEKGTVSKPWKKMEAIDSSSSWLHRRVNHANENTDDRLKELENKAMKRLLKRKLASEIGNLRKELDDMKKVVASLQPSLVEHRKRKGVSSEDSTR